MGQIWQKMSWEGAGGDRKILGRACLQDMLPLASLTAAGLWQTLSSGLVFSGASGTHHEMPADVWDVVCGSHPFGGRQQQPQ